ncbi:MAG: molybdopterin-dependent oxidoreductase [Anaerolineales bacterium]|nr:molybdopterin-dependent oxidoreductase [Anaerolineales bacterium]
MTDKISRRDFLKMAGVGAATTAVLTGCGPAARYVEREPYTTMPEYTYSGRSTYYATACRECAAGCGLVARTMQGRALKVEGNRNNPVNLGKTCPRGQATLHGLYNPDRVHGPVSQKKRGSRDFKSLEWEAAIDMIVDTLKKTDPGEIAFLMGLAPDHLFDLVSDLAAAIGAPAPLRFGALAMFEARGTLSQAAKNLFGELALPFFDIANTEVTLSFGANFLETWLSPVSYTRGYSKMRKGNTNGGRGYLVQFEARMSQTAAAADEWIPARPGTEGLVAQALGKLVAEQRGDIIPHAFDVDVAKAAETSGVAEETLRNLAGLVAVAGRTVAIPGGAALGQSNGLETAEAILTLNIYLGNTGQPGGVYLSPVAPLSEKDHNPASVFGIAALVERMESGKIKTLFVHGINPVFEFPKSLGFEQALTGVPQVISFATFPDETAVLADYLLPDHHGLESWGYQRVVTGTGNAAISGAQPVVVPYYDTRSTVDILLAAAEKMGGKVASVLSFADEVEFIQSKLADLVEESDGFFSAPEVNTFLASFQQFGGWWKTTDSLGVPENDDALTRTLKIPAAEFEGKGEFHFLPFVSPILGEAGANKPWLQEVPDPTTTVTWNTWVEINPVTARELDIKDDDIVRIVTESGSIEAAVYLYPAIRPDTVAVPFGQGHTAYGRYAQGRGANPADVLGLNFNAAGDLSYAAMKVRVEKTGKKHTLARLESRMGVYGLDEEY